MALTDRWYPLKLHGEQSRLWNSDARFRVIPSGRRSGKTEIAKRFVVMQAIDLLVGDRKLVCAAPTRDQAKRLYWDDLKDLTPKSAITDISETELTIRLINGSKICVVGMDKPERIEGDPLDGIVLDEFANMKKSAWTANVRPALSTPGRVPGWAWFVGVPEGRNHYYDTYKSAKQRNAAGDKTWDVFHWKSAEIMDLAEVEAARGDLDPRTFRQEFEGSFETFAGLAYYNWSDNNARSVAKLYDPDSTLIVCFDFNTSPGIAVIAQEFRSQTSMSHNVATEFTGVIGEVWIPQHSTTPLVCERIIADWGYHRGKVKCYGDSTGGAKTTVAVQGSDWDLIRGRMREAFGSRVSFDVPKANPRERVRVNAVNTRIANTKGEIRLVIDPREAPHVVNDFESVQTVKGGSGEILKESGGELTHVSDALGYYIARRFPVVSNRLRSYQVA